MIRTFYEYVMTYRGEQQRSEEGTFAEAAFRDPSFPKQSTSFEELSRYVEETEIEGLEAAVFDDLYQKYEELHLHDRPILPLQYEE